MSDLKLFYSQFSPWILKGLFYLELNIWILKWLLYFSRTLDLSDSCARAFVTTSFIF
jgi:hypothetical protein